MEHIRNQVAKFFEMFDEEVFYDAVGYDEHFGPSPEGEGAHVDPRNWDLFWVTHPNGPLEEFPRGKSIGSNDRELEFPREDATQGLIDYLLQEGLGSQKRKSDMKRSVLQESGDDELDGAEESGEDIAEDLRSSIAKLSTILKTELALTSKPTTETQPSAAENELLTAPRPPSLFANVRLLLHKLPVPKLKLKLPSVKFRGVKLPTLKLPTLKLPTLAILAPSVRSSKPGTAMEIGTPKLVKKEHESLHYARTPLATYARVKSRLQDRPPLVAAFADQVSVLSPSSLIPKQTFEEEIHAGKFSLAKKLRTSVLLKNLRDLLPTPVASLLTSEGLRKRSLVSILGGRAAKKVVAEIEVIDWIFHNFNIVHCLHTFSENFEYIVKVGC